MRQNDILIDKGFLLENFSNLDPYYIETLGRYIHNFLMNVPVPVIVSKLSQKNEFTFSIGNNSTNITVSEDYAYHDYVTLIRSWTSKFYINFDTTVDVERPITEDEVMVEVNRLQRINEFVDMNEILLKKVKNETRVKGNIEKVIFKKDEFVLNFEDVKEIRISGSRKMFIRIKSFMKNLRCMKDDKEIYSYIMANSTLIKRIDNPNAFYIDVTYTGKKMINFFKINYKDLKDYPLEKVSEFVYTWRNFEIQFENSSLKDDCLQIYNSLNK